MRWVYVVYSVNGGASGVRADVITTIVTAIVVVKAFLVLILLLYYCRPLEGEKRWG